MFDWSQSGPLKGKASIGGGSREKCHCYLASGTVNETERDGQYVSLETETELFR